MLEVYEAIFKNAPCTTNEALKDIYSGSHGVGSRTTELRDLGVIYEKSVRKCKVSGRSVIEWDLTDKLPNKKPPPTTKQNKINNTLNALRELYKKKNNSTKDDWIKVADLIKTL
jgi:hypothetical protein